MTAQLKKLLTIGAIIGVGYLAFNRFSTEKIQNVQILSLEKTRKILQQIKHQTLIVTVTFAEGIKQKMANAIKGSKEDEKNELVEYFRTKMTEIYQQKQNLILNKYNVTKLQYQESLIKHNADPQVKNIQNVIIQAMERSINGEYPDLTVDPQASDAFGKAQLQKMYEEISKAILVALTIKLRDEKKKNPQFDSNDNDQFKKAVRELNVFDKKAQLLRKNGFKEKWGEFNEVFFKLLQTQKMKDPKFKERMKAMEQIYDEAVEKISQNPVEFKTEKINEMFAKKGVDAGQKINFLSKSMDYSREEEQNAKLSRSALPQHKERQNIEDDVPDEANA